MSITDPEGFAAYETFTGIPLPADPIAAIGTLRREVMREIERLIAFLDATGGDADLEGELAGFEGVQDGREGEDTDAEPSLGWPASIAGPRALDQSCRHDYDIELDEADQEPSLASPESVVCPDLSWSGYVSLPRSQVDWARGNRADLEGDPREDDEDSHDAEDDKSDYEPDNDGEAYLASAISDTEGNDAKPSPKYAKALRSRRARSRRAPGWKPGPDGIGNVDMSRAIRVVVVSPKAP
jgi:hypothetical protein